jgi:PTS system mannose-specific IIA component
MIGVVIVGHCNLGREFLSTLELIIGPVEGFQAVSIDPRQDVEKIRSEIAGALKKVDSGEGALILTDMFGGTPSNISLSFLDEKKVEVISGVNLPMLIKLASFREGKSLEELASFIKAYGQKNISIASEILRSRGKK